MSAAIKDGLPGYQVAAVLKEYMSLRNMTASDVDRAAGYSSEGVTRKVINGTRIHITYDKAERLIDAVGANMWEVPDYNLRANKPRKIRMRMVICACGCGTEVLSHYIIVRKNGQHKWQPRTGLEKGWNFAMRRPANDVIYLHGHKSRTPEAKAATSAATARSWEKLDPARRAERTKGLEWTAERRAAHSQRMRELHKQGRFPQSA